MIAETRREEILRLLEGAGGAMSAARLAERFSVSRQVIVGDIALLRASGAAISATPRGYVLEKESEQKVHTVVCCHSPEQTEQELNIIVDNGCAVRDVIVEHPIYGQLTGQLELRSRYDVRQFVLRSARDDVRPLSLLTDGIHLHTLLCPDEEAYRRVLHELGVAKLLYRET